MAPFVAMLASLHRRFPAVTLIFMEHPCEKCGAAVEDGIPFCRHCGAPQIRVGVSYGEGAPQSNPRIPIISYAPTNAIQWSQALPSTALAGLIAAVLMFIPLGAFGLGMLAGGFLAVFFYRRRVPLPVTPSLGAKLGAASGTLGFGIFAIFMAVEVLVLHTGGELRAALLQALEQSASRTSDPQAQQVLAYLKSPAGLALVMGLGLAFLFVFFLILSSLGGALGAAVLRRKERL